MDQYVHCSVCDYDYSQIIATLQVKDNDDYQTTEVIVNQRYPIAVKTEYKYRSQGNLHILFQCEEGHYFIKSFDGHKGNVSIDDNPLMAELADYLNKVYKDQEEFSLSFNYELLGNIEKFFKSKNR